MTTYLGKSCSFCLPRVPFVNCRQFMYLVISLLVLRAGYGIWLYQFLIIAYLFTWQTYGFTVDSLFAARCPNMDSHWTTKCHRWGNSTRIWPDRWFEPRTSCMPCENSDHWAKEPHAPSTCDNFYLLNKIHPRIYSEPYWNRWDSPCAVRSPNMDPHGATKCQRGGKLTNHLYTGWGSNPWSSACKYKSLPRRYKSWLVPQGSISVCYIFDITTTYSGCVTGNVHRGYLTPSIAGSFQIWFVVVVVVFQ